MAGNDYGQQFRSSLDQARNQVITQLQGASTAREQTVTTLGHAEQTLSVDDGKLADAQTDMAFAEQVYKISTQGGVLVTNAENLAANAATSAATATNAMAVAATSIKALADVFDTLAAQVAGVYAIATNDDAGTAVDRAAKLANSLTNSAADAVQQLKAYSLDASIDSAKSKAAAASLAVTALGNDMQDLVTRSAALLTTATTALTTVRTGDVTAATAEKAALEAYSVAKINDESLSASLNDVDGVVNGALTATQDASKPQITASYVVGGLTKALESQPSGEVVYADPNTISYAVDTVAVLFFAVPADDAPAFEFDTAVKIVQDWESYPKGTCPFTRVLIPSVIDNVKVKLPITITTNPPITNDTNAKPLVMGGSYTVYVLSEPKRGGIAAARASDLSLAANPSNLVFTIPTNGTSIAVQTAGLPAPAVATNPPNIFQVVVTNSPPSGSTITPDDLVAEYRSLVVRLDTYRSIKDDALFLADLLNSSYYKVLAKTAKPIEPPPPPANVPAEQPKGEITAKDDKSGKDAKDSKGNPTIVEKAADALKTIVDTNKKKPIPAPAAASSYSGMYVEGDTDSYGDIIDPGIHYVVLALMVGGSGKTIGTATPPNTAPVSTPSNTPSVLAGPTDPFQITIAKALPAETK